jgi:hypothetical protein
MEPRLFRQLVFRLADFAAKEDYMIRAGKTSAEPWADEMIKQH